MAASDIHYLSAGELGRRIHKKEISPSEAVKAYLDRTEKLQPTYHAYITVNKEEAMEQAKVLDKEAAAGKFRGPLHGVPVAIKDPVGVKGWPSTGGSRIFKDNVVNQDSTIARKLKEAGAVIIAKANMTEMGIAETTEFPWGTPKNPWNHDRSTGSSSAGSGAATAAFMCAASLGGDTGGSIRIPASYCGLVGLRPSFGRVSRHGVMTVTWSMDTIGPMTRTVEDTALMTQAIAGYDPNDRYTYDAPVPDYTASFSRGIKGLRVGVIKELIEAEQVDKEVAAAVKTAVKKLHDLGAKVEEVSLPMVLHSGPIHWVICYSEFGTTYRDIIRTRARELTHMVRIAVLAGSLLPAQSYYKALLLREMLRRQVLAAFDRFDVLVSPTMPTAAMERAKSVHTESKDMVSSWVTGPVRMTAPFSHANTPALSVPCGMTSERLPIGLQIVGKPLDEETVLRAGHAYEQATDWHTLRPPGV
ncbi:MAG: Asp-tRNA(Asn)/Glu-tRNA(Gln) amidotransferase subunit GatA [SAR202 cluster bacterium]|nr:Asp-tRNA(Asn)/Glu-tRNA(Gln) amidotransferase subunit GatA [SAR202 cluster bacterium]